LIIIDFGGISNLVRRDPESREPHKTPDLFGEFQEVVVVEPQVLHLRQESDLHRKVDVRLPGKGNDARPVHLIITMILWIRTSRLSIKNSLSLPSAAAPPFQFFFSERERDREMHRATATSSLESRECARAGTRNEYSHSKSRIQPFQKLAMQALTCPLVESSYGFRRLPTRWTSRVSLVIFFELNVTQFAPHNGVKLIA